MIRIRELDIKTDPQTLHLGSPDLEIHWLSPNRQISDGDLQEGLSSVDSDHARSMKAEKRRFEFLRTRWLARQVLQEGSVERSPEGFPVWPSGIIGSISHKQEHCFIGLARGDASHTSIGIDVESIKRMKVELKEKIVTATEWASAKEQTRMDDQRLLTLIFSFKEALFKAHFPFGKKMFWFHDVEIDYLDDDCISARNLIQTSKVTGPGFMSSGHYQLISEDLMLTGLRLEPG